MSRLVANAMGADAKNKTSQVFWDSLADVEL